MNEWALCERNGLGRSSKVSVQPILKRLGGTSMVSGPFPEHRSGPSGPTRQLDHTPQGVTENDEWKIIQSLLLWTRQGLPIELLRFGIEKKLDTNDDDRERPNDFVNRQAFLFVKR